jgi:translation elongation factor P/translation initiation factor 5A
LTIQLARGRSFEEVRVSKKTCEGVSKYFKEGCAVKVMVWGVRVRIDGRTISPTTLIEGTAAPPHVPL